MTLVNLTPHDVVIFDAAGTVEVARIPASGEVARLATIDLGQFETVEVGGHKVWIEGIEFHHLLKPPPKVDGTRYIVSLPTALAAPRDDFLVPFDEVRDGTGRIIGVKGLAQPV